MMSIAHRKRLREVRSSWAAKGVATVIGLCLASMHAIAADSSSVKPLELPLFKTGETVSFTYETKVHNATDPTQPLDSSLTETFEIKILNVTRDDANIYWTLRSADGTGAFDRANAFYAALKDVPVNVIVDPSGEPEDIANWDGVKDHFYAGAVDDNARKQIRQLDAEQQRSWGSILFSQILVTMAAMQGRDSIAFGHTVLDSPVENDPAPAPQISVSRSIDFLGSDPAQCTAKIARTTTQTVQLNGKTEPPRTLETIADVSTSDGWIVDLHETHIGDPNFSETTDIRRNEPNPC
jgi:hypothetical protein